MLQAIQSCSHHPVVVIPLEPLQLSAGLLTLLGIALGFTHHPAQQLRAPNAHGGVGAHRVHAFHGGYAAGLLLEARKGR